MSGFQNIPALHLRAKTYSALSFDRINFFNMVSLFLLGAFHLVKISRISGSAVNGTRFVGSSHRKIPRKSGKTKKVGPFSRLEIPNGISCSIYTFLVVCTSSRSTARKSVGHRDVPGFTTNWNNFLPIGNSTFAPTEISGFFLKWKAPTFSESLCYVLLFSAPMKTFFFDACQMTVRSCVLHLFAVPQFGAPNRKKPYNKHLISLVFSVRTVNYGSSFFSIDLWPARFVLGP